MFAQMEARGGNEGPRILAALGLFLRLLGPDWDGWRHAFPLFYRFNIFSDRLPHPGAELATWIRRAARMDHVEARRRAAAFGSPTVASFEAAELEFDTFELLASLGLKPRFVPERPGRGATHDISAVLAERPVALELKRFQQSADEDESWRTITFIMNLAEEVCWQRDDQGVVRECARLVITFGDVSGRDAYRRREDVRRTVLALRGAGGGTTELDDVCRVEFAPGESPRGCPVERGPLSETASTATRLADVRKVIRTIDEHARQVPQETPGIFIIRTRSLMHLGWEGLLGSADAIAHQIQQCLRKHEQVSTVVLTEALLNTGGQGNFAHESDGVLGWSIGDELDQRHTGIRIDNPAAALPLTTEEREVLLEVVCRL